MTMTQQDGLHDDVPKADMTEREKQIVATILKESEFIRNEILIYIGVLRNILISSVTLIGILLTISAGLLTLKAGETRPIKELIFANRWPLWTISIVGIITCVTYLRIYVGTLAGISAAAAYYRGVLQPRLNAVLKNTESPVLNWENWLRQRNENRKGSSQVPGEDLI